MKAANTKIPQNKVAPFGGVVTTQVHWQIKKMSENLIYARFETTDGRVVRLLTAKSVNTIPLKTWMETSV